jgi:Fur family transcriptional regulator, ferric uptake regulator
MTGTDNNNTVKQIFTEYLEKKGHRKTPERFSILEEIYANDSHFDVEGLLQIMLQKEVKVSKATLYNTIELLLDCNLITRHQFGRNLAYFEKTHECKQHDHVICDLCGKVVEFWDPRINDIAFTIGQVTGFKIENHTLYFNGLCSDCQTKNKKIKK